ncbi:MAG: hypothetical protein ACKOWE_02100 [Micrococcales bacterium]
MHERATKAGKRVSKTAKNAANALKKGSIASWDFVDEKFRANLDKSLKSRKSLAIKNVNRLRAANPSASPIEIIEILMSDLNAAEAKPDNDAFSSSVSLYVFSVIEIYGDEVKDFEARDGLAVKIAVLDSAFIKNTIKYAPEAVSLLVSILTKKGKMPKLPIKGEKLLKFSWVPKALAKFLGIKNVGRKSISLVVDAATRKALGLPPELWPE